MTRSLLPVAVLALLSTPLAGCIVFPEEIETSLLELDWPYISATVRQVVTTSSTPTSETQLEAYLGYDDSLDEVDCRVLPKLKARVGSIEIEISKGGFESQSGSNGKQCKKPRLSVSIDDLVQAGLDRRGAAITLWDATGQITLNLGDALVERAATLVDPPSSGYRPGQRVTVGWSAASDLAATSQCSLTYKGAGAPQSSVRPCGGGLTLELSSSTLLSDSGAVHVEVQTRRNQSESSVSSRYSAILPIRVVAP